MRRRANADIVHLMHAPRVYGPGYGGAARWYGRVSVSTQLWAEHFAHELGHNLGGHHQPDTSGAPSRPAIDECVAKGDCAPWQAYAFAHGWRRDGTPEVDGKLSYSGTAVASSIFEEPIFSTVRVTPDTLYRRSPATLGIAGERENERAFEQSIPGRAMQSVDDDKEPLPPSDISATLTSSDSMSVSWTDNSVDEVGFQVRVFPFKSATVSVDVKADQESVEIGQLPPGRHRISVGSVGAAGDPVFEDVVWSTVPGAKPPAPSLAWVKLNDENPWCGLVDVGWDEELKGSSGCCVGMELRERLPIGLRLAG